MSCKWSPKSDDYMYDACDEYDFIFNEETHTENQIATLFQPNDSDQVKRSPMKKIGSEISFLLRQTGISATNTDYKLSSDRTGLDLLGDSPFTVTGFPNHPLPSDHFKLGNGEESTKRHKKNVNAAEIQDSTNANSTCLVVNLPDESLQQEPDVGLWANFVATNSEENSKKKKKKTNKESEASKQKSKNVTSKKSKKTRWTAIKIPEVDIFAGRPNLLQSLRPG